MEPESRESAAEPADDKPGLSRTKQVGMFLFSFALPWLVGLLAMVASNTVFWNPESVSQNVALGLRHAASAILLIDFLPGILLSMQPMALMYVAFIIPLIVAIVLSPYRLLAISLILLCLGMISAYFGLAPKHYEVNFPAAASLAFVAQRGQPIIDALTAYNRDNGCYPEELQVVVPRYLASIPNTGLAGFPAFGYKRAEDKSSYTISLDLRLHKNDFRDLFFNSTQKYDLRGKKFEFNQPVGKWVYHYNGLRLFF